MGYPWLPALLRDTWMRLSPICDRWESAYSTTSTTGSFWPSRRWFNIAQDPPPQPLTLPGAQGQLCQEHTITQPMSFVPGHSYRLSADDSNCLSGVNRDNSAPRGLLQGRYRQSAKSFPELGLMVAASLVLQLGLLHMRPIQFWLKQRGPSAAWRHGCHCVTVTLACVSALAHWRGPLLAKARRGPRHGAQKEGCHDRCFQQELGSTVRGQTDLRPLVRRGVGPAPQLPRNASSVSGLSILPAWTFGDTMC